MKLRRESCFHRKKYDSSLDLKIKKQYCNDHTFFRSKISFPILENSFEETYSLSIDKMIEYPRIPRKLTKHERSKKFSLISKLNPAI